MALLKCPECGNTVSEYATACAHCGKPLAPSSAPSRLPTRQLALLDLLSGIAGLIASGIGLLFVGVVLFALFHSGSHDDNGTRPSAPSSATDIGPAPTVASMPSNAASNFAAPASSDSAVATTTDHSPASDVAGAGQTASNAPPEPPRPYYSLAQPNGLYGYEQAISPNDQNDGLATKTLLMIRYLGHAAETGEPVFDLIEHHGFTRVWCIKDCAFARSITYTSWGTAQPQYTPVTFGTILWEITQDILDGNLQRQPHPNLSVPVALKEDQAPASAASSGLPLAQSSAATIASATSSPTVASGPQPLNAASSPSSNCSAAAHTDALTICGSPKLNAFGR